MGRLSALTLAVLGLAGSGCDQTDKDAPLAPKARSQAVAGTGSPSVPVTATATTVDKPTSKAPRKLCEGQLGKPGKLMPKSDLSRAAAPGVDEPEGAIPVGGGKWTWINFWAAWCVPCKEEMPRLIGWEKKLATDGKRMRLVFLSLDDDPRQLQQFLKGESNGGVRSTFWLREGKEREDWLSAIEMDTDPELPAHVLVDPSGKARCVINGAVEDSDYTSVAALLGG